MKKRNMKVIFIILCICLGFFMLMLHIRNNKEDHILDGPGMVYEPAWTEFSVSRSDTIAQNNFYFSVSIGDAEAFVTGSCRDKNGTMYEAEEGIPISAETVWDLRRLGLELLSDRTVPENIDDDEIIILDDYSEELTLTLTSSEVVEKIPRDDTAFEIYRILLPYFVKYANAY